MSDRPVHPAAAVWPMLADDELQALADDIKANGLIHPIVLTPDGEVLDGRNRLAACEMAGVDPEFVEHNGDPVAYVLSSNAQRRHVSKGQKAMATVLTARTGLNNLTGKELATTVGATAPMITWARTVAEHAATLIDSVLASVEPMPLKTAYDEAVRIRDIAAGTEKRLAKIDDTAPDLADLIRFGTLTLAGAEAEVAQRKKDREKLGREAEHAAAQIGMTLPNVLAIVGAIQQGFDIDTDKVLAQLTEGINALTELAGAR